MARTPPPTPCADAYRALRGDAADPEAVRIITELERVIAYQRDGVSTSLRALRASIRGQGVGEELLPWIERALNSIAPREGAQR